MSKKNKNKKHRVGPGLKTENIGSIVILSWVDAAKNNRVFPYHLIDRIVECRDEKGDYLEHISKKNQAGQRIHVIERKYLRPGTTHSKDEVKDSNKWYARFDDFVRREYEFYIEKNGIIQGNAIRISDISKKPLTRMHEMLSSYRQGGLG